MDVVDVVREDPLTRNSAFVRPDNERTLFHTKNKNTKLLSYVETSIFPYQTLTDRRRRKYCISQAGPTQGAFFVYINAI